MVLKSTLISKFNFGVSGSKVSQKCSNVKCWSFPHIYIPNGVFLTSWWLSSIMGPWRSIRVLFQRKRKKIVIFSFFENPLFFNQTPKKEFLGYESDRYVKKLHFFSIFRIFKFWSILTTFDPVLT